MRKAYNISHAKAWLLVEEALRRANREFYASLTGDEDRWDTFGYSVGKVLTNPLTESLYEAECDRQCMYYSYTQLVIIEGYHIVVWRTGGD